VRILLLLLPLPQVLLLPEAEIFYDLLNHCLNVLLTRFVTQADNGSSAGAA